MRVANAITLVRGSHPYRLLVYCIRMGSPYQSYSMRHAHDVCEGICNRKILIFSYYCKYGVLVFGDDGTGSADESKGTKRIQEWFRQILGEGFFIICNTITL